MRVQATGKHINGSREFVVTDGDDEGVSYIYHDVGFGESDGDPYVSFSFTVTNNRQTSERFGDNIGQVFIDILEDTANDTIKTHG